RNAIIKDATKKLYSDPRNIPALTTLSDLYYEEENWEKAFPLYKTLFELTILHPEIDEAKVALRFGVSAYKLGNSEDAMNGLVLACKRMSDDFDANYYLGLLMSERQEFDKAASCFRKANIVNPDLLEINEALGLAYYNGKHFKESIPFLKRALDEKPEDKKLLFSIASAMDEIGHSDKALNIFTHLRTDPEYGALACIAAGKIHEKTNQAEEAIQDYEIALKLEGIPADTLVTVYYQLANVYLSQNNISQGLQNLRQIQMLSQGYKDVDILVQRYQELLSNANLQTYLVSGSGEFVSLCRQFVVSYYADASVKIEDVIVVPESVEIVCHVDTPRWEDMEIFRFYRSTGSIGELFVRDLHSKLRELKCDKGFYITAGTFSETAHKYVEGRPIDLIEKNRLITILKKMI
ncbi:MAG: tetratricopeptide repeat protein, partial [Treponema sp.]|nr:tetratricopeptide repeat protein [Treponema sp.]